MCCRRVSFADVLEELLSKEKVFLTLPKNLDGWTSFNFQRNFVPSFYPRLAIIKIFAW